MSKYKHQQQHKRSVHNIKQMGGWSRIKSTVRDDNVGQGSWLYCSNTIHNETKLILVLV